MSLKVEKTDGSPHVVNLRRSIFLDTFIGYKNMRVEYYDEYDMDGLEHCYVCGKRFLNNDLVYISIPVEGKERYLTCHKCSEPFVIK